MYILGRYMNKLKKYINNFNKIQNEKDKTYIVTGANSGLGFSVTKHLASLGARVIMACRNLDKAEKAKNTLLTLYPSADLIILPYDQADFKSIDTFVDQIISKYHDVFGIVLNAGIFHPKKGLSTKDGYPLTVGTNYLGVFYLLHKLQEQGLWSQSTERRLIFIGSLSWYKVKATQIKDILTFKRSSSIKEYSQSKTLLGALAFQLAKHQKDIIHLPKHIKVLLMHPGIASTNIVASRQSAYPTWFSKLAQSALSVFVHSSDKAALGIMRLLLEEEVNEQMIIVPRGLFHISGFPTIKRYPKNLKKIGKKIINVSKDVISQKE